MQKLSILKSTLIGIFAVSLLNVSVYGLVEVKSDIKFTEETDIAILVGDITKELDKLPNIETLNYSFEYQLNANTDAKRYITNLQSSVIERLDGVSTITPSLSTVFYSDKIVFKLRKYIPESDEYNNILNKLVKEAQVLKTDYEKVHLLGNYLYSNGFSYNYSAQGTSKTSKTVDNPNCMPDGVLSTKKGICLGFTNLTSDYFTRLGIPCVKLRGHDVEDNAYHIWNMVYLNLDGEYKWYCVDILHSLWGINRKELIMTQEEYSSKMNWEDSLLSDIIRIKYEEEDLEIYRLGISYEDYVKKNVKKEFIYALSNEELDKNTLNKIYKLNNSDSLIDIVSNVIFMADIKVNEDVQKKYSDCWKWSNYYTSLFLKVK